MSKEERFGPAAWWGVVALACGSFAVSVACAVLLFFPRPAAAQAAPERCYPGLSCPGEVLRVEWARGSLGWHLWAFYKTADGALKAERLMCLHEAGKCMTWGGRLAQTAQDCKASSTPKACADQAYAAAVDWVCTRDFSKGAASESKLCAESYVLVEADARAHGIDWPPRPWEVDAATSADGTRPAYVAADGVRASRSTARAQAGQPCKPSVTSIASDSPGKVWAAFGPAFDPGFVALCKRGD